MIKVPVVEVPPGTLTGAIEILVIVGAWTVTWVVWVIPFATPLTFTVVAVWTGLAVKTKVPVVEFAGTVTVAGTDPAALSDERVTTNPPTGALLERVTVPAAVDPPSSDVGLTAIAVSVGAVMASGAEIGADPYAAAEMFAVALAPTATVVIGNVAVVEPEATVTVAGTVAFVLSDDRVTV
jgi:hypothetical protein